MSHLICPNRRTFFKLVDKRSRKAMTEFLTTHFRYDTGHSWNASTSYACKMKLYSLGLPRDIEDKLYEMVQVPEFYGPLNHLIRQFGQAHNFQWQAAFNGRSGGYLVLYQGKLEPSGHRSYCTACGQHNYTSVADTGTRCGWCGENARVDYPETHMQVCTYPFRGTDDGEDFEDWQLWELRERTELVQEFDRLADDIVAEGLQMAQDYDVKEEILYVPVSKLRLA